MPPDFLNSREDAILLWTALVVGYLLSRAPRAVATAPFSAVRAFTPKLVLLFGSALVYSALLVYAAKEAGIWHTTSLKASVYWFVGTAVVLVSAAATHAFPHDDGAFIRRVFKRMLGITILIEVAVNLYAFPLAVEVILVGLVLVFGAGQFLGMYRKLSERVLAAVGFVSLGYVAVRGVGDLLDGVTRERAEELLVGPSLTIALIPLLYVIAWWSRREQDRLRTRFRLRHGRPKAKWPEEPLAEADRPT